MAIVNFHITLSSRPAGAEKGWFRASQVLHNAFKYPRVGRIDSHIIRLVVPSSHWLRPPLKHKLPPHHLQHLQSLVFLPLPLPHLLSFPTYALTRVPLP